MRKWARLTDNFQKSTETAKEVKDGSLGFGAPEKNRKFGIECGKNIGQQKGMQVVPKGNLE